MPYKMRKLPNSDLYKVWNTETGEVHSHGSTLENAKKQIRLLHMIDNEPKGGEIEPPMDAQYTQEKGEAPYGTGVNHKGRKKGSKNKVRKLPKTRSVVDVETMYKGDFEPPLSLHYDTTWRWVLRKEKELQKSTIPKIMKHAEDELVPFYYRLKHEAEKEEDEETMLEPYTDEDERVGKSMFFTIEWLDKNYMKWRKKLGFNPKPQKEKATTTTTSKKDTKKADDGKQRKLTDFISISGEGLDLTSLSPMDQHVLAFLKAYIA